MAGLYKLNTQTGNITPYKRRQGDKHSILSNSIESILPHQGKLLLATNNGICVFDPETGKSQRSAKYFKGFSSASTSSSISSPNSNFVVR